MANPLLTSALDLANHTASGVWQKNIKSGIIGSLTPDAPEIMVGSTDFFTFTGTPKAELVGEGANKSSMDGTPAKKTSKTYKVQLTYRFSDEVRYADEEYRLRLMEALAGRIATGVSRAIDLVAIHGVTHRPAKLLLLLLITSRRAAMAMSSTRPAQPQRLTLMLLLRLYKALAMLQLVLLLTLFTQVSWLAPRRPTEIVYSQNSVLASTSSASLASRLLSLTPFLVLQKVLQAQLALALSWLTGMQSNGVSLATSLSISSNTAIQMVLVTCSAPTRLLSAPRSSSATQSLMTMHLQSSSRLRFLPNRTTQSHSIPGWLFV